MTEQYLLCCNLGILCDIDILYSLAIESFVLVWHSLYSCLRVLHGSVTLFLHFSLKVLRDRVTFYLIF